MAEPFDTNDSSVSKERTAGQPERYAHGSVQIAEACAKAIFGESVKCHMHGFKDYVWIKVEGIGQYEAVERMKQTLDAIHETRCEGTKPNA